MRIPPPLFVFSTVSELLDGKREWKKKCGAALINMLLGGRSCHVVGHWGFPLSGRRWQKWILRVITFLLLNLFGIPFASGVDLHASSFELIKLLNLEQETGHLLLYCHTHFAT